VPHITWAAHPGLTPWKSKIKKIECGIHSFSLISAASFDFLVVFEILRVPGLGEQVIGASDFHLRRIRFNSENLRSSHRGHCMYLASITIPHEQVFMAR